MNITKNIRNRYANWKLKRLIWSYCLSQTERAQGAKAFNSVVIFVLMSLVALWQAGSFWQVGRNMLLVLVLWSVGLYLFNKKEYQDIVKACKKKLATIEFAKRIDAAEQEEVLKALEKHICSLFQIRFFEKQDDILLGVYGQDKLALVYRYEINDELVETRDIMQILHDCRQKEAKRVRIFTNSEFSNKAGLLGERFGLEVKLFNGTQLKRFLQDSSFYPSESELDTIIKRESEKRQKKISIIKTELLKKNKTRNYALYSLVLFFMAKYDLGNYYLNMFFAVLMLILAALTLIMHKEAKREEVIF
ncbi:MAG: hypothetical protein CVU87_10305 [Firmicutes bacterium HGW-Firmicutes-12]|nr:MAG: hypothetical protein CVU87_10305 [Firmicutes bacterium HGW-Firmicutes-12]